MRRLLLLPLCLIVLPAADQGSAATSFAFMSGAPRSAVGNTTPSAQQEPTGSDFGDRYSRSLYSMGTLFEITVITNEKAGESAAAAAVDKAFATIARLDTLLSTYKPFSQISRLNRSSGGELIDADPQVLAVLDSSLVYWEITDGAFDVTVGPLLDLWGFKGRKPGVPDPAVLAETLALVDAEGIEIDRTRSAVRLRGVGQGLDLGGIGKGFALDRAADVLKAAGIENAMINAGGNLLLLGERSPGKPWMAGIVNPRSPGDVMARFQASNVAVSTSGDYEDYFIWEGVRYSHILDPRTGHPTSNLLSVTVIAPAATGADALSTGIVVLGLERGMELVESISGVEAVLVTCNSGDIEGSLSISSSSGLKDRLEIVGAAR